MFKLILDFDNIDKKIPLPYDHQYALYSAIIKALSNSDSELSNLIHTEKKFPMFVMSQLLPSGKKEYVDLGILSKRYVLLLVSAREDVVQKIGDIISQEQVLYLGGFGLKYFSSRIEEVKTFPHLPELVTRSPLVLRDHERYVSYGDPDFLEILKMKIMDKFNRTNPSASAKISFLRIIEGRRKLFSIHNGRIPCSIIKFVIDTDEVLLENMMTYGIGAKTQMGFGMIEVSK